MSVAYQFHFHQGIKEIPEHTWNRLAGCASPFLQHAFLLALEESACVSAATGWQAHHLLLSKDNSPVAALPLYIKQHSWGEYVFDWAWADACERGGLRYYPKLLTAIPYTPSQATRLLLAADEDPDVLTRIITDGVIEEARRLGASSWHVLFPTAPESERLAGCGVHQRIGTQFHWFNRNYSSFDAYLDTFSSRKRKNLRKERESVRQAGIEFTHYKGHEIKAALWQDFYRFYENTYHVRGQQAYLTLAFFERLGATLAENILLVIATEKGRPIAAALSLYDDNKLYGRYWGCLEEYQFLHFETCYYQGIEFCIEQGLSSFDSGAQGEHKIQRGFEPIRTYSNHWLADPRLETAIVDFLQREAQQMELYREQAASLLPFKRL